MDVATSYAVGSTLNFNIGDIVWLLCLTIQFHFCILRNSSSEQIQKIGFTDLK